MEKPQSIEEFYQEKFHWMPDNLKKEIGHFNVFSHESFATPASKHASYSRKDYYKVSLFKGAGRFYYADKMFEFGEAQPALTFTNPQIPYTFERLGGDISGFFCIFTDAFFGPFGHMREYPVFKPGGMPIFFLSEEQIESTRAIFLRMIEEIDSDYTYKYDLLRNLVSELVHSAVKMHPAPVRQYTGSTGTVRVATLFTELLERQFPIESPRQQIRFRQPVEFAGQLSVHVNHLNRSLKEVTGKTTSRLIADRVVQEARTLLRRTDW